MNHLNRRNTTTKRRAFLVSSVLILLAVAMWSCSTTPRGIGHTASQEKQTDTPAVANQTKTTLAPNTTVHSHTPGLKRDPEWVALKIARKTANKKRLDEPQAPKERAAQRYQDRVGDDGVFSLSDILKSKEQADLMLELVPEETEHARDAGIWQWEWLGPGNIGGRIRSILIDPTQPQRMWVGAVSGGIWHTTNGGASWSHSSDFLPSLAVSTMAMDPDNPDVIYAGTGEVEGIGGSGNSLGAGIFKSTNGGATWHQLPDSAILGPINRLAIDPEDGQRILAATEYGIYRNLNAGEGYWSKRWPAATIDRVLDVKFDYDSSADQSRVVAGLSDGRALFSDDAGSSWDEASFSGSIGCTSLDAAFTADGNGDDDLITVFSTSGFVVGDTVEINTGTTETSTVSEIVDDSTLRVADLSSNHAAYASVCTQRSGRVELAVSRDSVIYASMNTGGGTIWRSTDHGETYSIVASAEDTPNYFIADQDPNSGGQGDYDNAIWVSPVDDNFFVVGGIDLWRSDDGGKTLDHISRWREYHLGTSAHADQHYIIAHPGYDGNSNKTVFVGNDGGIQKTDDIMSPTLGALGWTNLANNLGITQFYAGAASTNGDLYGGAQDNGILKLAYGDGVQNWFQCISCTGDGGPSAVHPEYNNIVYASTQRLNVQRSNTWGNTYLPFTTGLDDSGSGGNSRFIAPLAMDPGDPDVLVAGGAQIWETGDLGVWSSIRGEQPLVSGKRPLCSAIEFTTGLNVSIVYVGYDTGRVSHTTSDHESWVNVDTNGPLPNRVVTDIAVNPNNWREVIVVFGGYAYDTVWYSDDSGLNWEQCTGSGSTSLPHVHVNTATFHPTKSDWIYIGTDVGVFASEDKGLTWNRTPRFSDVEHDGPVNTEVHDLFWHGSWLIAATHGRGMWRVRPMVTVYVDAENTGAEDGSVLYPYDTVGEGLDAAGNGSTVRILDGEYEETGTITVNKRLEISVQGTVTIR